MLPSRTRHSHAIGPGVVPRGCDPSYDLEVQKECDLRKGVAHRAIDSGRPFQVSHRGAMQRTQYVFVFVFCFSVFPFSRARSIRESVRERFDLVFDQKKYRLFSWKVVNRANKVFSMFRV